MATSPANGKDPDVIVLPADAIAADTAIRERSARVLKRVKLMEQADALGADGHTAEAEQLMAEAKGEAKVNPKTHPIGKAVTKHNAKAKKAAAKTRKTTAKKAAPAKPKPKAKRRKPTRASDRHEGRDINYPKTAEDGKKHAEAVRAHKEEQITKCPPAKAAGVETTADVKNPKSEVVMRKRERVTKPKRTTKRTTRKTTTTRRKPAAKKTTARKTTARKAPAKKTTARKAASTRAAKVDGGKKIRKLVKECPHNAGSKRAKKWALLRNGMTYQQAVDAMRAKGLPTPTGYLRHVEESGWISIK